MAALTIIDKDDDSTVSADEVAAIVQATRVLNVRLDEVHAGPLTLEGSDPVFVVSAKLPKFAYVKEASQILVRLEHEARVGADESLDDATEVVIAHVISCALEEDLECSAAALSAWVEANVYFLAYPYVRETFASITSRMGLTPLTLDYLSRDERPFQSASDEE